VHPLYTAMHVMSQHIKKQNAAAHSKVRHGSAERGPRRWLPLQFDITVHIDETRAVHPLDSDWEEAPEHRGELPLTFPFGV